MHNAQPIPEPLHDFSTLADSLRLTLDEIDSLSSEYRDRHAQGRILPNLVEALRIESVSERPEYLAALDEANTGKIARFAGFILHSVEQSLLRYLI